jgi:predicted nucleotidyltransferase
MLTQKTIHDAAVRAASAASSSATVMLFGSYAGGDAETFSLLQPLDKASISALGLHARSSKNA